MLFATSGTALPYYGDKLDDDGRRHLARVREAAQRMALLIDDLLALSRVTRAELVRERVDLSALAVASVARLRRLDPERTIDVVIEPGLTVQADARLLSIALDNLFGNAWKFTAKTAAARVELGSVSDASGRSYFVRDNGAGFDPQYSQAVRRVPAPPHGQRVPGDGYGEVAYARRDEIEVAGRRRHARRRCVR